MEENVRELTNKILASEFRLIYFKIAVHKPIHMKYSLLNFVVNGYIYIFYNNVLYVNLIKKKNQNFVSNTNL